MSSEAKLSREEAAHVEVGTTTVSRQVVWLLIAAFFVTIVGVPLVQHVYEIRQHGAGERESAWPQAYSILGSFRVAGSTFTDTEGGVLDKTKAANRQLLKTINQYEDELEDQSLLKVTLLSPTQQLLTRWGGAGNEQAYVGRDGWLFYRPGIDYLTGRPFLNPRVLAKRAASGSEVAAPPEPDPRKAILQFKQQLDERGIQLIIMPTPVKAMIHPEKLSSRYDDCQHVLQNPSYEQFKTEMEQQGVLVFDVGPHLFARKLESSEMQFLETDTHWTPGAMQFSAEKLSELVSGRLSARLTAGPKTGRAGAGADVSPSVTPPENDAQPPATRGPLGTRLNKVENLGDIAAMMKLPDGQTLYKQQPVTLRQVFHADDQLWRSSPDAEILLLGDSFTNIFSLKAMNWGEAAGFAEQLSFALQATVDRIAQNDAGAYATRQTLSNDLARGNDRLAGKKVVVWQFAIRELAVGDWKLLPMKLNEEAAERRQSAPPAVEGELVVMGTVQAASGMPKPGSVPYSEGVTSLHVVDVQAAQGGIPSKEIVVFVWGMRDNALLPAARFQGSETVTLKLTPWSQAEAEFGRFTRVELDDPDFVLIELPTYWGEFVE